MEAVEEILLKISDMACELPELIERDLNPLIVTEAAAVVVDARLVVARSPATQRRYAHMAIHPYPRELTRKQQLADGTDLIVRPIRPEDARIEQEVVRSLSDESRRFRFFSELRELTQEMLVRFTQID